MATARQALYSIIPIITLVVALRIFTFLNMLDPIMTDARPITIIPVPLFMFADSLTWLSIEPESAVQALPIVSPIIFIIPGFFETDVTNCWLSPVALSRRPDLSSYSSPGLSSQ